MKYIIMLLLITACTGSGSGSPGPAAALLAEGEIPVDQDPPADTITVELKHYRVVISEDGGRIFSGTMCGQEFTGLEFECDADRLDVTIHTDGTAPFRMTVDVDGAQTVDDVIPLGGHSVTYRDVINE